MWACCPVGWYVFLLDKAFRHPSKPYLLRTSPNQLLSITAAPTPLLLSLLIHRTGRVQLLLYLLLLKRLSLNIHKLAPLARHAAGHHLIGRHWMTSTELFLRSFFFTDSKQIDLTLLFPTQYPIFLHKIFNLSYAKTAGNSHDLLFTFFLALSINK